MFVLALVASACSGSDDPAAAPSTTTAPTTTAQPTTDAAAVNPTTTSAIPPACGSADYPCRWGDVDPAVREREGELMNGVGGILDAGSLSDVYDWLQDQDGVAEVFRSDDLVTFRLAGGMPMFVLQPDATAPAQPASSVTPTGRLARHGRVAAPTAPAIMDVVGHGTARDSPQNRKRALFLTPFRWQADSFYEFQGEQHLDLLREIPDYGWGADAIVERSNEGVTPRMFQGWDAFDFIFVETHGSTSEHGTFISTGVIEEWVTGEDDEANEICNRLMQPFVEDNLHGVGCGWIESESLDKEYIAVGVLPSFWGSEYGLTGGLDKAVVYLGGCGSIAVGDVATILAGGTSDYLGWTNTVYGSYEGNVASSLLYLLASGRRAMLTKAALDALCRADLCGGFGYSDSGETLLGIYPYSSEPGKLRIYDVPTLRDPKAPISGGVGLQDGATLRVRGTPGDGENDKLDIAVDLFGIIDPDDTSGGVDDLVGGEFRFVGFQQSPASLYNLRFYLGDAAMDIGADNLGDPRHETAVVTPLSDSRYRYVYTADLGFDVPVEGHVTTLKVEVALPEGGISDYEVDVKLVGAGATITVGGQTWDFELIELLGASCTFISNPDTVQVAGAVDGDVVNGVTFNAVLRADGGELFVDDPGSEQRWMAAADREGMTGLHLVPGGDSQIDSIRLDGNLISGTATFIDTVAFDDALFYNTAYPSPVTGSFEIACPSP